MVEASSDPRGHSSWLYIYIYIYIYCVLNTGDNEDGDLGVETEWRD